VVDGGSGELRGNYSGKVEDRGKGGLQEGGPDRKTVAPRRRGWGRRRTTKEHFFVEVGKGATRGRGGVVHSKAGGNDLLQRTTGGKRFALSENKGKWGWVISDKNLKSLA